VQNVSERQTMIERTIVIVLILFCIAVLVVTDFGKGRTVVYDCRDAHWLPDIPIEVKKECSKLLYERWKEQDERKNDPSIHENRTNIFRT
jgi:hypothetical protein